MDFGKYSSVLITGGRGFIGSAVVRELRRAAHAVVSLDQTRLPQRQNPIAKRSRSTSQMPRSSGEYSHRVTFQGLSTWRRFATAAQSDPELATRVNIDGSLNLLEMARQFGVRRFIFGSSLSVYGSCAANRRVSEEDRPAPDDLYGAAKNYVEQLGDAYRSRDGVEFVSLRIGRAVGPGAHSTSSAWRSQIFELLGTKSAARIELPYRGSESLLVVHVDDVARALATLLFAPHPRYPVYNVPCEAVLVNELKREIESLNPNLTVTQGNSLAKGNPRLLDASRFQSEFNFRALPSPEQLRNVATSS
jgi:nucleoside-diphosphate-sugar epimerase